MLFAQRRVDGQSGSLASLGICTLVSFLYLAMAEVPQLCSPG